MQALTASDASARYPANPIDYPDDVWVDPITDIAVPKTLLPNLEYRKRMVDEAHRDEGFRRMVIQACSLSPLFFLNTFAWTYRPKYTCEDGRVRGANISWQGPDGVEHRTPRPDAPVITWPAQDIMVSMLEKTFFQGGTMLADKSREQGATVIIMYTIGWAMLHRERFSALVISRKADMVDGPSEDSLFGKVDYLISKLPEFFLPEEQRDRRRGNNPFILNKKMESRILGETSNKDVGQSLRTTITFVDEAARFPDGRALMKSIESVSAGYILASTPSGPGTEFSRLRERSLTPDGRDEIRVCTLGYWDHPEMGRGRELVCDVDGQVTGKNGTYYWESPAFRVARARATSIRDIRENWLIDHDTSGLLVLDSNVLVKLRSGCRPPIHQGTFDLETFRFLPDVEGKLKLWTPLDKDGDPSMHDNYVIGCDVSQGVDESNTVLAVMSRTTGEIVAEYADPSMDPAEAALLAAGLGQWFGGQHGYAFIIFERNGPGLSFGHTLVKAGYPFVYYQKLVDRRNDKKTKRWGWQSTGDTKEILFSGLNRFMRNSWFITYSEEGVADMAMWIFDEHGRIVSGKLRDLSTGAQARHGDRSIAYAVCCIGVMEAPQYDATKPRFKPGTFGKLANHERAFSKKELDSDPFRRKRRAV